MLQEDLKLHSKGFSNYSSWACGFYGCLWQTSDIFIIFLASLNIYQNEMVKTQRQGRPDAHQQLIAVCATKSMTSDQKCKLMI